MKVLLLGAKGNLGSQLKKIYKDEELSAWDKENADVLNLDKLVEKIIHLKPQVIINTVAFNNVDQCEVDAVAWSLAQKLNVLLPKKLAEISLELGSILVQYSSDYVFGQDINRETPYLEYESGAPVNKYGLSKQQGEEELLKLVDQDLKFYLIRTSKLFGPNSKNLLAKPNFFDIMIKLANQQKEIKAVDEELSSFTYTPDLAEATKNLLDEQYPFGVYHLTNRGQATWYQGAVELFKLLNQDLKIIPVASQEFKRPALRPTYSVLANTKAKPLPYWKQALSRYLETKN